MKLLNIEDEIMNNTNISRNINIQFYLKSITMENIQSEKCKCKHKHIKERKYTISFKVQQW